MYAGVTEEGTTWLIGDPSTGQCNEEHRFSCRDSEIPTTVSFLWCTLGTTSRVSHLPLKQWIGR